MFRITILFRPNRHHRNWNEDLIQQSSSHEYNNEGLISQNDHHKQHNEDTNS
jgi:hypothetical protein